MESMGWPSIEVITSLGRRPASAAGESLVTSAIMAPSALPSSLPLTPSQGTTTRPWTLMLRAAARGISIGTAYTRSSRVWVLSPTTRSCSSKSGVPSVIGSSLSKSRRTRCSSEGPPSVAVVTPSASTVALGPLPPVCTTSPGASVTAHPDHGGARLVVDAEQGGGQLRTVGQVGDDGGGAEHGDGGRGDGASGVEHHAAGHPRAVRGGGDEVHRSLRRSPQTGVTQGRGGEAEAAHRRLHRGRCPPAAGAEGRRGQGHDEQGPRGADGGGDCQPGARRRVGTAGADEAGARLGPPTELRWVPPDPVLGRQRRTERERLFVRRVAPLHVVAAY